MKSKLEGTQKLIHKTHDTLRLREGKNVKVFKNQKEMREKIIKWSQERDKYGKENPIRGGVTGFLTATLMLEETGVFSGSSGARL